MHDASTPPPPRPLRLFPPVLMLGVAFGAGVYADRAGWLPRPAGMAPASTRRSFAPFWEAYDRVQKHYVDRDRVRDDELRENAIRGMVDGLGDRGHTRYLSRQALEQQKERLKGEFEGIGAALEPQDSKPTIRTITKESPAARAGLRPGDVVVAVDGKPVDDLKSGEDFQRLLGKIRGKAGSTVKLEVRRGGTLETVELRRDRIEVEQVTSRLLPGTPALGHVVVHRFSNVTTKQLVRALKELRQQGAQGLVLDLRNNEGGYKAQAVEVASQFLREGQVVFLQEDAKGDREEVKVEEGGDAPDLPLVVLVNGRTASSAEILAGALQDNGRAKVVGTRTLGTGTVLREFPLSDGSAVLLAVYKWRTPSGRTLWRRPGAKQWGIDPDIRLTEKELADGGDPTLRKAAEILQKQIG